MSALLTPEEVGALTEGGRGVPGGEGARHRQRLRIVDFTRPTKFTHDHQRRIIRSVEAFCQTATTRLSAELRSALEMETMNTVQVTWSAAQLELPPGAMSMALEIEPLGTQALLATDIGFLLLGIEILLGGGSHRPPPERRLSEIDWALAKRLLEIIVKQLAAPFQDLAGVTLSPGDVDISSDTSRMVPVSEPTFVIEIEIRLSGGHFPIVLLLPWAAIEQVADRIAGREHIGAAVDPGEAEAIGRSVATVPVRVRAEVAAMQMAVSDILALTPGSVITFPARAEHGVAVFAENTPIGHARPGSHGSRRAVQMAGDGELRVADTNRFAETNGA